MADAHLIQHRGCGVPVRPFYVRGSDRSHCSAPAYVVLRPQLLPKVAWVEVVLVSIHVHQPPWGPRHQTGTHVSILQLRLPLGHIALLH